MYLGLHIGSSVQTTFFLNNKDFITLTTLYREQLAHGNAFVRDYISERTSNICLRASQASKTEISILNPESKPGTVICLEIQIPGDMIYSLS